MVAHDPSFSSLWLGKERVRSCSSSGAGRAAAMEWMKSLRGGVGGDVVTAWMPAWCQIWCESCWKRRAVKECCSKKVIGRR